MLTANFIRWCCMKGTPARLNLLGGNYHFLRVVGGDVRPKKCATMLRAEDGGWCCGTIEGCCIVWSWTWTNTSSIWHQSFEGYEPADLRFTRGCVTSLRKTWALLRHHISGVNVCVAIASQAGFYTSCPLSHKRGKPSLDGRTPLLLMQGKCTFIQQPNLILDQEVWTSEWTFVKWHFGLLERLVQWVTRVTLGASVQCGEVLQLRNGYTNPNKVDNGHTKSKQSASWSAISNFF